MIFIYKCSSCRPSRYYAITAGISIKCPYCDSKEREQMGDMEAVDLVNRLIQWARPDEIAQLFSSPNLFPKKEKKPNKEKPPFCWLCGKHCSREWVIVLKNKEEVGLYCSRTCASTDAWGPIFKGYKLKKS